MNILSTVCDFCFYLLGTSLILSLVRLWRGPTSADRALAFDLIACTVLCLLTVLGVSTRQGELLDICLVLAVLSFISTVSVAYYLEQRHRP